MFVRLNICRSKYLPLGCLSHAQLWLCWSLSNCEYTYFPRKEEGPKIQRGVISITGHGGEHLCPQLRHFRKNSAFSWLFADSSYLLPFARKTKQVDFNHEIDIYWVNYIVTMPFLWLSSPCQAILLSMYFVTLSVGRAKCWFICCILEHWNWVRCDKSYLIWCVTGILDSARFPRWATKNCFVLLYSYRF